MSKVLIGSSVRQDPEILACFLDSLRDLDRRGLAVDYMFVDDNDDPASTRLLKTFRPLGAKVAIVPADGPRPPFARDETQHYWSEALFRRVARAKNLIMDHCRKAKYDYLLLLDSDLVLHPRTLLSLVAAGKDIVSEIFWTRWRPDAVELPQVWLSDDYVLFGRSRGEQVAPEERQRRESEFLSMLRRPGIYRVGGLGACTLFSLKALKKGVSFDELYNLSFLGEDRHLCVRAVALGFELFVDTFFPAYHIYRRADLEGVPEYIASFRRMTANACAREIRNVVGDALENLLSLDFRRPVNTKQYRRYFTDRGWAEFNAFRIKERRRAAGRKGIWRAVVAGTGFTFDDEAARCETSVALCRRGSERGRRAARAERILLRMADLDGWKIDGFGVTATGGECKETPATTVMFNGFPRLVKPGPPKITLAMLVRNEADRYLPAVLAHAARYVDEAVILDDASTDSTVEVCRRVLKDIPSFIHVNETPGFANEVNLRKQLWELALRSDPDWILCLDADEMFEDRAVSLLRGLVSQPHVDVLAFRLYDFWDPEHYREDGLWNAHLRYWPYLVRHQPRFAYEWHESPVHCGRFPKNVTLLPVALSDLRIKHLGWADPGDRLLKYRRYMETDPEGKHGSLLQYRSILDPNPNLRRWREKEYP